MPLLLLLLVLFAGCASRGPSEPVGDPYVKGPVDALTPTAPAPGLLVRGGPESREPCGISARTDGRTGFFERLPTGELRRASLGELQIGDTVEVYVTGPVAESCPVQGYASTVVLVARPRPE